MMLDNSQVSYPPAFAIGGDLGEGGWESLCLQWTHGRGVKQVRGQDVTVSIVYLYQAT